MLSQIQTATGSYPLKISSTNLLKKMLEKARTDPKSGMKGLILIVMETIRRIPQSSLHPK